jgi:hypothetical protein
MEAGHAAEYVEACAAALLLPLDAERRSLQRTIRSLEQRRELARRRAAAASNDGGGGGEGDGTCASASGRELVALKLRLARAAAGDEDLLLEMVAEVRAEKDRCTEAALQFYAERTRAILRDEDDGGGG